MHGTGEAERELRYYLEGVVLMRYYENDELRIPKIYKMMSKKQLEWACEAGVKILKLFPYPRKKKAKTRSKVEFYL